MEQSSFTDEVKRLVLRKGAGLVGIADPRALAEVSGSKDPFLVLVNAKAVIVFAVVLDYAVKLRDYTAGAGTQEKRQRPETATATSSRV